MPNPLSSAWNWATSPVVPQSAIKPAQDAIAPTADSSPWGARARGFGQGALEGLRSLTTPLNIVSAALPMTLSAAPAAEAVSGLRGAMGAGEAAMTTLPEFAAATPEAEAAVNAARPAARAAMHPLESAYQRITQAGGMRPAPAMGEAGADTAEMMRRVQAAKDARRAAEGIDVTGRH